MKCNSLDGDINSGYRQAQKILRSLVGLLVFTSTGTLAIEVSSQLKSQLSSTDLPAPSQLRNVIDNPVDDTSLTLRLNLANQGRTWSWFADYQLSARQGDLVQLQQQIPELGFDTAALADDDRRLFDLSHRLDDESDRVIAHRLDRLYLSHRTHSSVFAIGRQAISWGNGLIYNPLDFFNPFDPTAIDTEYKTGDDMVYGQYLYDTGDDLQIVWVVRRDSTDKVASKVSSIATKYHGFTEWGEYDLLLAEHFDQQIVAIGASLDYAEAVWRSDAMFVDTGNDLVGSAVLNGSYSWIAWGKNVSATVEFFHNGFGIADGNYTAAALAANPQLTQRLARGELFTLAENYLALTLAIELQPLWVLNLNLYNNLDDHSRLLQVFSRHDLQQDLQLLLALNLPTGEAGSEFGDIDVDNGQSTLAGGNAGFAQLTWYF